ncbi:serpin-ZX-like [Apium graveolens]|uniref:serpin-ZX-like n=1 Tax=Apium graveolens TaxID=4045 RepID=UPI003D7BF5D6
MDFYSMHMPQNPSFLVEPTQKQFCKNQVDVSLTLAKHLLLNYGKTFNLVFSPISIQVVLSLLAAGSSGETLTQLLAFLKAESIDELNSIYARLVDVVFADGSSSGGPIVSVANGVWLDQSLSFKPSYRHVVQTSYKAASHRVDFKNKAEEVRNLVNSWVDEKTRGCIKDILSPGSVDSSTQFVLANALYFKGKWRDPFDAYYTKHFDFHLLDSSSVQVPFMTSSDEQYISVFNGFKVLKLPYQHAWSQYWEEKHSFSMYIFLPDAKEGLAELVEKAGSECGFLDRYAPNKAVQVGDFRIPKFKFEYIIEASEALKSLKLVLPFSAGLTNMVDASWPLLVSKIVHKSFIEVDEKGTEAAAATVACMAVGCSMYRPIEVKIDFVADHPFLFVIRENTTGMVQFIGHVLNPLSSSS